VNPKVSGEQPAGVRLAVVVTVVVALSTLTVLAGSVADARPTSPTLHNRVLANAMPKPILGILGASGNYLSEEKAAGIQAVTVQVGWTNVEATQGVFSATYMGQIQAKIAAARSAGLEVVLDPGLQYPPPWVFSLSGGTRFVDQYGDVFSGSEPSGDNVANAVTDTAVRSAEGTYLAWLGSQITAGEIIAVREGGGPLGELRYPLPDESGHTNEFWAYDASTQATLPTSVQGWVPGTGTVAQATAFLTAYNQDIDNYAIWLNAQLQADFATKILVLLPGWGERPGTTATEEAALLHPSPSMDEYNEGLDWTDLLPALPDAANSIAYTTYLDARTVKATPQLEDPADYLASLVAGTSIGLGGENTGVGNVATMQLCMGRALALGFFIVDWNGEAQVVSSDSGQDPSGPTLAQLGRSLSPPPAPLSMATTSLPLGTDGDAFVASLTAVAGYPPYAWSLTAGSLPPGLALDASGTVAGTPIAVGRWAFRVEVTDAAHEVAFADLSVTVSAGAGPAGLTAPIVGMAATPDGGGYWIADAHGDVKPLGDAVFFGSMAGQALDQPIAHIVATADGAGYWLVAADGGTFAFGDAHFYGSMGGAHLDAPVVDMAPTGDGGGYWLVASDGGIFAFGDAAFRGSMGGHPLNRPVVGISADRSTGGYWEVATDGGIFAFGAPFEGSTGSLVLNRPVNGMAPTPDGDGYWFVASDGGVFAFGDAGFHGSVANLRLVAPIVGMCADTSTGGYWLIASDGGVFAAGSPFLGAA
jgi:hypothetical protein